MKDNFSSISAIIKRFGGIPKSGADFLTHILSVFMSIKGRINFLQLARHSSEYGEQTCRNHFEGFVDFAAINAEYIKQHGSGYFVATFDLTYLRKAGHATAGLGNYWSSVAQKACWGIELGLLSIVDIFHHTAYHLDVLQTPGPAERKAKQIGLPDHYAQCVVYNKDLLKNLLCRFLVVDAYFAKREFIDRITGQTGLEIITRLRRDANCKYLYKGPKSTGRGAPKKYDGKVDWHNPDLAHFTLAYQDQHSKTYHAQLYCVFLKRIISVAFCQQINDDGSVKSYKIYACTDLKMTALLIQKYYQPRFQQEFLIRDAKQHTGLQDCQARSTNKIEYHANVALTAINIAKFEHWLNNHEPNKSFSMADIKTLYHNQLLMERLFSIFPEQAELIKNNAKIKELYYFGSIAA